MNRDLTFTPFFTLFQKEIRRFLRVIVQTIVVPMINSTLYLLVFGVSLGAHIQVESSVPYLAFLIPGLVMMGVLNNAYQNSSSSISISKFHGDLEDLKIAPMTSLQIVFALGLAGLVRGLVVGAVIFSVGQVFAYFHTGSLLGIDHPAIVGLFLVFGGLTFALLGITIGFWAKTLDQLTMIGEFILLPLVYLGGVFFPLTNLHPFWKTASKFNPMFYYINGVRYGVLSRSDVPWTTAALFCAATLVVLYFMAAYTVRRGTFSRW